MTRCRVDAIEVYGVAEQHDGICFVGDVRGKVFAIDTRKHVIAT